MLMKPFKMKGNGDASPICSQVHTTQQAIMNTTYFNIMALSITPPSLLSGCWWWEDQLKDSSTAQVELREFFIILSLQP